MKALTARAVESLKPQPGKRLELADHAVRGLSLRVSAAGVKSWTLRYRNPGGQQRRLTLGGFPTLSLEKARAAGLRALGQVSDQRDPAREKSVERRSARQHWLEKPQTLADLWRLYASEHLPSKRASTAAYHSWLWSKCIGPRLGGHFLADLGRSAIRAAAREIGAGAPVQANRALALLRRLLNIAVEEEIISASPLAQVGRLFLETSRDRVLSDAELRSLWGMFDAAPLDPEIQVSARMCAALKLALLTGARAGDVVGLCAAEIDIAARTWIIPARRFKGKRAHTIPLSDAAWAIIGEAFACSPSNWAGHTFPHARDPALPMRRASLTRAMQRICAFLQLPRATVHDLRRTAATYLASERIGVAPHVVGAVLGHAAYGATVTAIYNRHNYDREKRAALAAWADLLAEIVSEPRCDVLLLAAR